MKPEDPTSFPVRLFNSIRIRLTEQLSGAGATTVKELIEMYNQQGKK